MFDDDGPGQSNMVRVLLVLAIGIPVLIEVVTFGGLVGHYVGGSGDAAGTATPTADPAGAGVGDEILAETGPTERIAAATVVAGDDSWQFVLTVNVSAPDAPYELRLGTVTTGGGTAIDGSGATTGSLGAGQSGTVTGTWLLPTVERPDTVAVTAVTTPENGTASAGEYTVALADVSVSNG